MHSPALAFLESECFKWKYFWNYVKRSEEEESKETDDGNTATVSVKENVREVLFKGCLCTENVLMTGLDVTDTTEGLFGEGTAERLSKFEIYIRFQKVFFLLQLVY